jgi:hypothetical protein
MYRAVNPNLAVTPFEGVFALSDPMSLNLPISIKESSRLVGTIYPCQVSALAKGFPGGIGTRRGFSPRPEAGAPVASVAVVAAASAMTGR